MLLRNQASMPRRARRLQAGPPSPDFIGSDGSLGSAFDFSRLQSTTVNYGQLLAYPPGLTRTRYYEVLKRHFLCVSTA